MRMDFKKHVECFLKLLDNFHVAEFLKRDTCGALCDRYHLIIIFQFFMRAEFKEEDYTVRNFFLALTLSHDLYDESKVLKHIILAYYLSRNDGSRCRGKAGFHWDKVVLFGRMQFRGFMERKICQRLCQLIQHRAFYKNRKELHTGIVGCSVLCKKCRCPINSKRPRSIETDEISDKSKTPCDIEDVSDFITEEKAKRPRKHSPKAQGDLFFHDSESDCFSDEKSIVASVC